MKSVIRWGLVYGLYEVEDIGGFKASKLGYKSVSYWERMTRSCGRLTLMSDQQTPERGGQLDVRFERIRLGQWMASDTHWMRFPRVSRHDESNRSPR